MLDRLSASLAENLRRLREARGLTQQQLSDVSGVPRPTLAHLESGEANPTVSVLVRVASALSVSMEELIAASPSCLALHAAGSLVEHQHGGVRVRELCPDSPSGLCVERIELEARSRLERGATRKADRTYLACERGEVDVISGSERLSVSPGDVAVVRRGAQHVFTNKSRGAAVVYCVRIGPWAE